MLSYLHFQVVTQINQDKKIHVLLVLLQNFRFNVYKLALFLLNPLLYGYVALLEGRII